MKKSSHTIELFSGLIIFRAGDLEFCADVKDIIAVLKTSETKSGPGFTAEDENTFRYKHYNIPVVSLHDMFNLQFSDTPSEHRIIIMEIEDRLICFAVDKVIEIITIDSVTSKKISFAEKPDVRNVLLAFKFEKREILLPDYHIILKQVASG